jgi:hypothetical protein
MSESTSEGTESTQSETDQAEQKVDTTDWKAKAREWESRAKANKTAADELAALKQSQMSEQERLSAQLAEAQKSAETARSEALRLRVAAKFGIGDEDADLFLTGADEATLTKQAERLTARVADRKKQGNHVAREGANQSTGTSDLSEFRSALFDNAG